MLSKFVPYQVIFSMMCQSFIVVQIIPNLKKVKFFTDRYAA